MPRGRDRSKEKRQEYLRAVGLAGYVPAGPVQERLRFLHDRRGVTFEVLAERTGVDRETVLMQYRGTNKAGKVIRSCHMATERKVLGARFKPGDGAWFPSVGIRRRLQALAVQGFTAPFLADRLPVADYRILHNTLSGRKSKGLVRAEFADAVIALYDKLHDADPVAEGVLAQASSRCRNFARRHRYVPRSCWDPDTIDDPAAIPEWTGACGTWIGARAHTREGIPMCPACAPHDLGVTVPGFSASKLRALRERSGLSRASLGELVGVNASTIQYWEEGRSVPEREWKIDKLLSVLDATFEDVTEEEPSE